MKFRHVINLTLFVTAIFFSACSNKTTNTDAEKSGADSTQTSIAGLKLTKAGIGPLTANVDFSHLPATFEGLYDKVEKELIEDAHDGDYTMYTFSLAGKKTIEVSIYDGPGFSVTALSENISFVDGVHPGMPITELLAKGGVELHGHMIALLYKDAEIGVDFSDAGSAKYNDAYLTGDFEKAEASLSASDFMPDAKITSITVYVE